MQKDEILQHFRTIGVWHRRGEQAPHKPLLLLLALGACFRQEPRLLRFADIDSPLQDLLRKFGPERRSYHSEYPFWRLQNDGIWELTNSEYCEARVSNKDAKKSELLKYDVHGGFTSEIYDSLIDDRDLLKSIAYQLLETAFPDSDYNEVLSAVGLEDL